QALPPRRASVQRLRVDDDALLRQQTRELVVVREGRDLGAEAGGRLRCPVLLRGLERALDRRALRGDLRDVSLVDLLDEEGAVRDANTGRWMHRARADVEVQRQ